MATNVSIPAESLLEEQVEDFELSDIEEIVDDKPFDILPLNIDHNNRILCESKCSDFSLNNSGGYLIEKENNHTSFVSHHNDFCGDTSCEELEVSDEDATACHKNLVLKTYSLDSKNCLDVNKETNSVSTFNHSSTIFKDEGLSDAEYMTDDEMEPSANEKLSKSSNNRKIKKLAFGLSLCTQPEFQSKHNTLQWSSRKRGGKNSLYDTSDDLKSPLVTCLEFLKSETSEGETTDVEDDLTEYTEPHDSGPSVLDDVLRCRGSDKFSDLLKRNARKSSWTMELLSDDDESSYSESKSSDKTTLSKTNKKRNSIVDVKNDFLTDEEWVDLDCKEWTETDESGSVRQITQIKTETSIKLEGDDAVKSLKKIPAKECPDIERKSSTDSEQEDLSFTEKKSYFQRLSITTDTLPSNNKWIEDVSMEDLPMAHGEIIHEQISFQDKFKMFEPDEGKRKKIQNRDKPEQPTVYRYDFTKDPNLKPIATEFVVSELEKAEEIVKQVSEELLVEESRLSMNAEDDGESAITLEKVEKEVYSLLAEVDKEEKKLRNASHSLEDNSEREIGDSDCESSVSQQEYQVQDEISGAESISLSSEKVFDQENYTPVLKEEEHLTPPDHPFDEPTDYALNTENIAPFSNKEEGIRKKDELHEAIKLDIDDNIEHIKEQKFRPSSLITPSDVDSHIKSEILQEEIDQSIEESPLEIKHIADDLEQIQSSEDHKCNVYKHIRTEIFTQELGADIESGSPERKELGAFSLKKSENFSDIKGDKTEDSELMEHVNFQASGVEAGSKLNEMLCSRGSESHRISPQISEESCGQTDDISSEGAVVEPDEQFDYEEAKDEHSLTEQLRALASDSMNSKTLIADPILTLDYRSHEFDQLTSGMSSSISDLEVHRRAKEIAFTRHDKKEIRSLKSTKQVSTIEEHSSIESCDSPQDLGLHDLPEKYDPKDDKDDSEDDNDDDYKNNKQCAGVSVCNLDQSFKPSSDSSSSDLKSKHEKSDLSSLPDPGLTTRVSGHYSDKNSKLSRSNSKSSQSKKSDSDAEGSKHDSTGESGSKRKDESCSSSGETESPYYSVETSDSGRTPRSTPAASRPCSSEFDINVFSGQGSEYETCVTSQEASGEGSGSYATAVSSQEISYATACSSFSHSSRESAYSVDSESSGHLASVEVSSEASETLVPSAQEMELEFGPELEMPVLDEEPIDDDSIKEPYDMDIPEDIIRGGIELPFMKNWDLNDPIMSEDMQQLPQQWKWQFATESCGSDRSDAVDKLLSEESTKLNTESNESVCSGVKNGTVTQPQVGPSHSGHRRFASSVMDIVPDKEYTEQNAVIIDEEQLSVSESSATHSEQTWQTSSIDTAVQLTSNLLPSMEGHNIMLDSLEETPSEKELTTEQGFSSAAESSYLQLNGPIEVDYNPDYDNQEGGNSELTSNQNNSSLAYETDGLQFDLEMEGHPMSASDISNLETAGTLDDFDTNVVLDDGNNQNPLNNLHTEHTSVNHHQGVNNSLLDADQPEAQQEQSIGFRNYDHQESESLICSDLTSYLPESDQCDLLSGVIDSLPPSFESEINIPCAESVSSTEGMALNVNTRSNLPSDSANTDSPDRIDTVDTSPEDERYEYKSLKTSHKSPREENSGSLNPESDYPTTKYEDIPGADLYTHQEEEEFDLRVTYLSPIPSVDEDKPSSTPSSLHGRKLFPQSGDTSAASSLQEFERLEAEIGAGRISRLSTDSGDKIIGTKSGEHDDISMSSLTEFEKLEREFAESLQDNKTGVEDVMMLSEIEEGLESQCSDAVEILREADNSEYERRRKDIEEVIKVAQCNVEKFQEETVSEGITSDECTVLLRVVSECQEDSSEATKGSSKEDGNMEFEESEQLALTLENDSIAEGHDSGSNGDKNYDHEKLDCMVSSTDSMDPSSSTATHATYQFETDSVMSSSLNSAQASGEECTIVSSTDTLEPENILTYSQGDSGSAERTHLTSQNEEVIVHSKGAFESDLKELQVKNGAKQQMEMFLSKLTDESVLMDDFASHSFPDTVGESGQQTAPDDNIESNDATQGFFSSGIGSALDSDDLVSTTTSTTTTRVVTSVTNDPDVESELQSTFVQQLTEDDIKQSCEITLNEVMKDNSPPSKKHEESEEE